MIAKKNPKVDLEKKRFAFFQIGLIVSGSICLAAFEFVSVEEHQRMAQLEKDYTTIFCVDIPTEEIQILEPQNQRQTMVNYVDEVTVVKNLTVQSSHNPEIKNKELIDIEDDGRIIDKEFEIAEVNDIVEFPDVDPSYYGGQVEMAKFINKNIKIPTELGLSDKGTIYISFVVNLDGSIEFVKILRGISPELDRAALKVVSAMPKWKPGESGGYPVRSRLTLPIAITH
jgi:protein TonB